MQACRQSLLERVHGRLLGVLGKKSVAEKRTSNRSFSVSWNSNDCSETCHRCRRQCRADKDGPATLCELVHKTIEIVGARFHPNSGRTFMNLLILVVDDEPDVEVLFRQQFRRDLRTGRFAMEFTQSGDMALRRIADAKGISLILILSDINMPGMTGLELLPKAKAARPDVPVIMITAYGDADTKRKALESGAEALLTKPIDFAALRSEIDTRVARAA